MKNCILDTIQATVKNLHSIGVLKKTTLQKFNEICLSSEDLPFNVSPVDELSSEKIKQLRLRENVSQADFALYLNTSRSTVQRWERGTKKPKEIELKMLNLIMQKGLKAIA